MGKRKDRKMNDRYDMKEQMKEIFETKGGKAFFNELNAAGIPFFFVAAVETVTKILSVIFKADD